MNHNNRVILKQHDAVQFPCIDRRKSLFGGKQEIVIGQAVGRQFLSFCIGTGQGKMGMLLGKGGDQIRPLSGSYAGNG